MIKTSEHMVAEVDIAVCTYRREGLRETLRSLGRLAVPAGVRVRVIIADNDITPSARNLVEAMRASFPFEIAYVHCPASNISIARNACLDHAKGRFIAFIDDDEIASEVWLAELVGTANATNADAVLGPVRAVYPPAAPSWMRNGDFHSTRPVWVGREILAGYTCNVLIRRTAAALASRRFSQALGRSGGEDTEYFAQMVKAGGRIAYAEHALVYEPVPADRAGLAWLARRRFRFGQTHGRLLQESASTLERCLQVGIAGSKAAYCFAVAAALAVMPVRRWRYGLRGILHVGTMSGLLGFREIEQYGRLEASPQ
jgi:succinoglycan biosynthesis protein ExoM